MKLRVNGNSLRLRISPSEMTHLLNSGRVEETIYFGPEEGARLTYALERSVKVDVMTVRYHSGEVTVLISDADAHAWALGAEVGMYGAIATANGLLEVVVEKDFACLDKDEEHNADTFPNPRQGAIC